MVCFIYLSFQKIKLLFSVAKHRLRHDFLSTFVLKGTFYGIIYRSYRFY